MSLRYHLYDVAGRILAEPAPQPSTDKMSPPQNPLQNVRPNMGVLGDAFNHVWVSVATAAWGLMIAAASLYLGAALLSLANARKVNNSYMMTDALADVKLRAASLGGLVALPVIVGAVIRVFSV